jgi:hypothetical protein
VTMSRWELELAMRKLTMTVQGRQKAQRAQKARTTKPMITATASPPKRMMRDVQLVISSRSVGSCLSQRGNAIVPVTSVAPVIGPSMTSARPLAPSQLRVRSRSDFAPDMAGPRIACRTRPLDLAAEQRLLRDRVSSWRFGGCGALTAGPCAASGAERLGARSVDRTWRHQMCRRTALRHAEKRGCRESYQRRHGLHQKLALIPSGRRRHRRPQAAATRLLPVPRLLPP